jgi:glycosidase
MPAIKSITDPLVQEVLTDWPRARKYYLSPEAWEDQVLYFFLPDRFSDGNESGVRDVNGDTAITRTTPLFSRTDRGNATRDNRSKKEWMDAGCKFVGGTLKGATNKLGYLKRLGVTAVWIGPVFKQVKELPQSYHGYGIQDFLDVDPRFGTREELQELVREAHAVGIYVILDIILNHCGDVFAYKERSVPYRRKRYEVGGFWAAVRNRHHLLPFGPIDEKKYPHAYPDAAIWPAELQDPTVFHRKGEIRNWEASPEYVEGDFYTLKSFDLGSPDSKNFFPTKALKILTEIYKFWIAWADIDGFRIDTVKHMGDAPTAYFVSEIRTFTKKLQKTNFFLVGEIAGDRTFQTFQNTGLNAALGIGDIQQALWRVPRNRAAPKDFFSHFQNEDRTAPGKWKRNQLATMIDDHDQIWRPTIKARFGAAPDGPKFIKAAIGLNLCAMGIPCIYYGTEQDFDGRSDITGRDHHHHADNFIREAMFGGAFGPFESKGRHCFDESSATYKALKDIADLRETEVALRRGDQYLCSVAPEVQRFSLPWQRHLPGRLRSNGLVAWVRLHGQEALLCAINTRADGQTEGWVTVDGGLARQPSHGTGSWKLLYPPGAPPISNTVRRRDGVVMAFLKIPPAGFQVYKMVPEAKTFWGLFSHF